MDKYSYHKYNVMPGILLAIGFVVGITLIILGLH